MTRYLLVASLLTATTTSSALAGELAFTEAKATNVPAKLVPRGKKVERVVTFSDKNGANYVVFSSTSSEKQKADDEASTRTVWLYVDHWAIATGKAPRALLPARDVIECYMGATLAKFADKAFTVTDLDSDGLAEITYGYQLACRSDVSTATYKLLLVENGRKHILRGNSKLAHENLPEGGTFKPEPDAKKWPEGFFEHAVEVWNATDADLDDPTNG